MPVKCSLRTLALFVMAASALCLAEPPKTRLAAVGLAQDGAWSWLKEALAEPDAELVAVADPHPELLERARARVPTATRMFADYERMLDEVHPDAVIATLPNAEHLAITRACAQHHIHLWLQKPMAITAAGASEMERVAREAGIQLMVSYHTLWSRELQTLNEHVRLGDTGPVRRLVVRHAFNASKTLSPTYAAYFLDPAAHGGGALMDQGTYGINYAVWLLGRPLRVFATAHRFNPRPALRAEDEVWVVLEYPAATALIYGAWWIEPEIGPGVGEVVISGPRGELRRDLKRVTFTPSLGETVPLPERAPHELELVTPPREHSAGVAHFVDCLRHGRPIDAAHSATLNIVVSEVVEAAYQSIRSGATVALSAAAQPAASKGAVQ